MWCCSTTHVLAAVLCLKLAVAAGPSDESSQGPAETLRKVVVLARHGTKVANEFIPSYCPSIEAVYEAFATQQLSLPNTVTPAGLRQVGEAGSFARRRYIEELQVLPGVFFINGSFSFTAQRSPYCIQSAAAFVRAMFPDGEGPPGGLPGRPQIVPVNVLYGQPFEDTLLNCAEDGICANRWTQAKAEWVAVHGQEYFQQQQGTLNSLIQACGNDFTAGGDVLYSLQKLKGIADALDWAAESGLDGSMGGRLNASAAADVHAAGFALLRQAWVGGSAVPLCACSFPQKLLDLWQAAPEGGSTSFDFYLTHRELMYAVLEVFQLELPKIPGQLPGFVACGSTIFFELHRDAAGAFGKVIFFTKTGDDSFGDFELTPAFCKGQPRCPLEAFQQAYAAFAAQNGTATSLCSQASWFPLSSASARTTSDRSSFAAMAAVLVSAALIAALVTHVVRLQTKAAKTESLRTQLL